MNKFEVVLIFNPDIATSTLKNEIEKIKAKFLLSKRGDEIALLLNTFLRFFRYSRFS